MAVPEPLAGALIGAAKPGVVRVVRPLNVGVVGDPDR